MKSVKSLAKVKVLLAGSTDIKEEMASFVSNKIIIYAQFSPDIFSTHYLECFEDGTAIHPYTNANYMVNNLPNFEARKSLIVHNKMNVLRMLKLRMECVRLFPATLPLLVARNNA